MLVSLLRRSISAGSKVLVKGYWLTCESLARQDGHLITRASTYKIPAVGDVPLRLNADLLENAPNSRVIGGARW